MSRCVSGTAADIKNRPSRSDEGRETLKQVAIERFVIQLAEEFSRVCLARNVVGSTDGSQR